MALNRQELLILATTVGLVLGVDFEKNISNINLQKKIEEKQEELANSLKGDTKFGDMAFVLDLLDEQIRSAAVALAMEEDTSIDDIKSFLKEVGVEQEKIDLIDFDDVFKEAEMLVEQNKQAHTPVLGEFGNLITDKKKIEEDEEDEEDNALILRKTECFTYRTEIIGFKETARRSNLTVEEIKEAIESGLPVGGYIFEFVG